MDFNKSFTIVTSIGIIMFIGMFWVLSISQAWQNTPTNYTININMDNNTKESVIRISELQKEILELENEKLMLESNTNKSNEMVRCLVGFNDSEGRINYIESNYCYIVNEEK